jgi:uncharacterized Zn finger protein
MKISERILDLFEDQMSDELLNNARAYRILDFSVREGSTSAKLHKTNVRNQKVELFFKTLDDDTWSSLFDALATKSFYFAVLLSETFSEELEALFLDVARATIEDPSFVKIIINGREQKEICEVSLALLIRLATTIDKSPWELFLLFGRGKDESILEIHERRRNELKRISSQPNSKLKKAKSVLEVVDENSIRSFWNSGKEIQSLSYLIRADELPAATIKRLDPLPLLGIEEEIESKMELAYERIARLAQSYGLGF